ncbi:MAG TPA: DUF6049 family protein, partial [Actinopolymorphaceae bacterium]
MGCRRRARATRPAAVLLSLLLVALGGLAVAVVPQAPAHAASPALRTTLDATTPSVTSETKAVELRGRVENTGKVPIEAVKASLWVSTAPITTREQLGVIADDEGSREGRRITIPESLVDDIADTLEPGEKADFRVRVPVSRLRDEYGMSLAGIYLVGVDIRGLAPGASIRQTWRVRTFLPWIPK